MPDNVYNPTDRRLSAPINRRTCLIRLRQRKERRHVLIFPFFARTCTRAADGTCSRINTSNAMRRIMLITAEGSHLRRSVKTGLKTLVKRAARAILREPRLTEGRREYVDKT